MMAAGLIGLTGIILVSIGAPSSRKARSDIRDVRAGAAASVSARGFSLASTSVDLPVDDATYPDGPHADVINANCTSCHSASMALTQPALSADQWKATVTKMREVYKAPVAEKDVDAIVAYLTAMPSQKVAPATGKAQDPTESGS
jgi:cytochrome c5